MREANIKKHYHSEVALVRKCYYINPRVGTKFQEEKEATLA